MHQVWKHTQYSIKGCLYTGQNHCSSTVCSSLAWKICKLTYAFRSKMLQRCFWGNPLLVAVCLRYLFLKSLKARQVLGNTLGTQEIPEGRKFWFSSWSKGWKMRRVNFQALLLPLPFKFNVSLSLILQKIRNSLLHWAFPTAKIALACKNPIVHLQVCLF